MKCKTCGKEFEGESCPACGTKAVEPETRETEKSAYQQPTIIINNTNANTNTNTVRIVGREKNKWVALLLCIFLGEVGAHKFYEGKIGMGILYLLTIGLFGIGWLVDIIILACKPNPYYV